MLGMICNGHLLRSAFEPVFRSVESLGADTTGLATIALDILRVGSDAQDILEVQSIAEQLCNDPYWDN